MFSLLSSTFVVSRVGILRSTSLYWPTTWRFFSQGHTRYAEPEDPVARRKRLDKKNEAQRRKYRDDAVFREHEITRAMLRLNSPLTREQNKRSMRLRNENWRNLNPTAYAEGIERINAHNIQRRASDPRFKFSGMLHNFLMHHAWAGDELPWKTHVPTVYPEKVTRQCARCDRRPPGGGAKLWWELHKDNTKEEADEYLCHACYLPKENWQDALPQGYEDVNSVKELLDRKKKLDGSKHASHAAKHIKST